MNDVVDELRRVNEPVPEPLQLPDEDEIVEVEEQLFIALGGEFRDYMLSVSDVVYGSLEPVTVADPLSHTYLPEVAAIAWDRGLPRDLVPLCEHNGDYYCVAEGGQVMFWQHGELTEDTWDTVWQWAREVWMES